jgi:hypothetical protein
LSELLRLVLPLRLAPTSFDGHFTRCDLLPGWASAYVLPLGLVKDLFVLPINYSMLLAVELLPLLLEHLLTNLHMLGISHWVKAINPLNTYCTSCHN